ncbi:MAG: hypothetical protein PHW04_13075 [Candidatus Wallbacteria bacterium]|nr:hypothetical protein [Candidatus Wallbacteria bacterium]
MISLARNNATAASAISRISIFSMSASWIQALDFIISQRGRIIQFQPASFSFSFLPLIALKLNETSFSHFASH